MKPPTLSAAAEALLRAEAVLRLIDRTVPTNLESERARLVRAAERGAKLKPEFEYAHFAEAGELRLALGDLARRLSGADPIADLFAGRASELALEAALVEALGTPDFSRLAAERFPTPEADEARSVGALLASFAASRAEVADGVERIQSDSAAEGSLLRQIQHELGSHAGSVRVLVRPELAAVAATGDGVIYVRSGTLLSVREAARIARHEVEAHALPRLSARAEAHAVFRVGTARSGEDEEGRALLIESRAGLLGAERRQDLALRHRLVLELRAGASFDDTFESSVAAYRDPGRALGMALRIHRGGGLGRELAYLPAFLRLSEALRAAPWLEDLMKRGRVSIDGARVLARTQLGRAAISTTTGA